MTDLQILNYIRGFKEATKEFIDTFKNGSFDKSHYEGVIWACEKIANYILDHMEGEPENE